MDSYRIPRTKFTGLLELCGIDTSQIHYYSSLGRWITEFVLNSAYVPTFKGKLDLISQQNKLSECYRMETIQEYDPLQPLCVDFKACAKHLPGHVIDALLCDCRANLQIRWSDALQKIHYLPAKEAIREKMRLIGLSVLHKTSTDVHFGYVGDDCINSAEEKDPVVELEDIDSKQHQLDPKKKKEIYWVAHKNWNTLTPQRMDQILPVADETHLVVYTDGAYNKLTDVLGIGVYFENDVLPAISKRVSYGRSTSARAEILSIYHALLAIVASLQLPSYNDLREYPAVPHAAVPSRYEEIWICSDSRYVIDGINENFSTWHKHNGKTRNSKKRVFNYDLFVLVNNLKSFLTSLNFSLFFHFVPSHSGVLGNEVANLLARAGTFLK
ncbi:Ribonuclease H [Zancudomyces culisetae]|uniref:ribonuclease H n=1 Tax=Zancudomyces culisetae TaxID=1213189 RepID=A0A1R1PHY4_ZANCU|nr:Ribonuclease H [Zancudomyces culisetae]|eukprot:OMH80558.1 Ribonuclease H [Zancudomyces culisetae]